MKRTTIQEAYERGTKDYHRQASINPYRLDEPDEREAWQAGYSNAASLAGFGAFKRAAKAAGILPDDQTR